jgi:3-methyladenine DNA glycosylase AlkC
VLRFDREGFLAQATSGLASLELLARGKHVGQALREHLPKDTKKALSILTQSLGPKLAVTKNFGQDMWMYLPHTSLLFSCGHEAFAEALTANYEVTQRFTAEWSVRGLLAADLERTLTAMRTWRTDENPHVRRLVSEGTRTRLPWATRVPALSAHAEEMVALILPLRDDAEDYVRRSVANHLNDMSKDAPELVLATCTQWLKGSIPKERRALVQHALRSLLKAGNKQALALTGAGVSAGLTVTGSCQPKRAVMGDDIAIKVVVHNPTKKAVVVRAELLVHFVSKTGISKKVFRLGAKDAASGKTIEFEKALPMVDHSIRKLYPGVHKVEALVNGETFSVGSFTLR